MNLIYMVGFNALVLGVMAWGRATLVHFVVQIVFGIVPWVFLRSHKHGRAVMGTLAEALVATAIGLLVAIPAVAAYNYFQRRIKSMLTDTEALTQLVLAYAHAPARLVSNPHPARAIRTHRPAGDAAARHADHFRRAKGAVYGACPIRGGSGWAVLPCGGWR